LPVNTTLLQLYIQALSERTQFPKEYFSQSCFCEDIYAEINRRINAFVRGDHNQYSDNSPMYERYLSHYILHLLQDEDSEYGKVITSIFNNSIQFFSNFFIRYEKDKPALIERFKIKGVIIKLLFPSPETRPNGASVITISFLDHQKLIYKPRGLANEELWNSLLLFFCDHTGVRFSKELAILNKITYGWTSYVHQTPCQNHHQLTSYYRNLGSMCSLLTILGSRDIVKTNLIADGQYPILFDLEMLTYPKLAYRTATSLFEVDRIGFIPQERKCFEGHLNHSIIAIHNDITDTKYTSHVPLLFGNRKTIEKYLTSFLHSYAHFLESVFQHKNSIINNGTFISLSMSEEHVIFRSTFTYTLIRTYISANLKNKRPIGEIQNWIASKIPINFEMTLKEKEKLLEAEFSILLCGDFPKFSLTQLRLDVFKDTELSFLEKSGYIKAYDNLQQLTRSEITRLKNYVEIAIRRSYQK
jgi:lantibiotic modifying enzyme